jgi:hypothetical protein
MGMGVKSGEDEEEIEEEICNIPLREAEAAVLRDGSIHEA